LDDTTAEEIKRHQATVESDDHSPLHLIREKEMEISGRVLSAKREADTIVSDARKQAAALVETAHEEASKQAGERETAVKKDLEIEAVRVREQADVDAAALQEDIEKRRPAAVDWVVASIIRV